MIDNLLTKLREKNAKTKTQQKYKILIIGMMMKTSRRRNQKNIENYANEHKNIIG